MNTLAEIYERHQSPASHGDKGTVHSYIEVYEELLAPYRNQAVSMLEIGILSGISLLMWEEYFLGGTVYGIDLCERPLDMADLRPLIATGHKISLLDATSKKQVELHFSNFKFDVIIEDASHALSDQLAIYQNFRDKLVKGGIYVIEDVGDIDRDREILKNIDPLRYVNVIDRRHVKGRFDDVLVVINA
jgi:8-demethyl-8-alpha-L-rhamnosyltetracenomycin-C 2'-O-methyltransferase